MKYFKRQEYWAPHGKFLRHTNASILSFGYVEKNLFSYYNYNVYFHSLTLAEQVYPKTELADD
ncbi:hypothetical protein T12_10768 [Trichinella patagoniensis]|uniref:Uncharacterized protein n=1 Tax=Trichinella patagoniensis TaxID=990121 RepID=A0A0V1AF75_9BILA|nr:hypothetical protein T09_4338 [Trichinella sp. T9]KRY23036.1 hypothetical protein T12_10768 [Trichinella patagoniensis]